MPDFDAIATAIAARYAAPTPPAGLASIRLATAELPGQLGVWPAVLVFPSEGDLEGGGGTRLGVSRFLARFYYGPGLVVERETKALNRWLGVLVDVHGTAIHLGLPATVARCRTVRWRVGTFSYADESFSGIELGLEVTTTEPWTPTP